jgi:hypothetical protein
MASAPPSGEPGGPSTAEDMAQMVPDLATSKDGGRLEQLTVTFTTTPSPSAAASPFDPNNVVAVWIENGAGSFVKTIGRWAATRKGNLVAWTAKAGAADVDAVSGATQPNYGTLTVKWDMSARAGLPMPADGTYTVRMELADGDVTQPAQNNQGTFTFTRNGTASTTTAQSNGGFNNVSVIYTGR